MHVPPETIAILRRLDPAELVIFLAIQGVNYQAVNQLQDTDKEAFLEAERMTVLAAAHKARNALGPPHFTPAELRQSREWLTANGYRTGITKHRNH